MNKIWKYWIIIRDWDQMSYLILVIRKTQSMPLRSTNPQRQKKPDGKPINDFADNWVGRRATRCSSRHRNDENIREIRVRKRVWYARVGCYDCYSLLPAQPTSVSLFTLLPAAAHKRGAHTLMDCYCCATYKSLRTKRNKFMITCPNINSTSISIFYLLPHIFTTVVIPAKNKIRW